MSKKYEVLDELIKDELREFLLWLQEKKKFEICVSQKVYTSRDEICYSPSIDHFPIHKAPEDLINEYMKAE